MTSVPASWNNLKGKVVDLDVGKLKNVPVDLKKLSDAEDNEVVKNIKVNTLNTKVNISKENSWCNYTNSYKSIQLR